MNLSPTTIWTDGKRPLQSKPTGFCDGGPIDAQQSQLRQAG